ncbi:MAG: glycosyltransferase [Alloprevotella sp.]|nr:glycosyltransferase [Alloprevotella sp.]
MKVSIIVPAYNSESFLTDCISSVKAQDLADWELIIVDDGSTDTTRAIANKAALSDSRIRVIHQPNRGLSAARNAGLDSVRGEFITFIDADDMVSPSFLSELMAIETATGADIVAAHTVTFTSTPPPTSGSRGKSIIFTPEEALASILYQEKPLDNSACGKLYRAKIWSNLRFTPGIGYEDLDIIDHTILRANAVAYTPKAIYLYRQHPSSYLHRFTLSRADVLNVTLSLYMRMEIMGDATLVRAARSRELSACFNILRLICRNRLKSPDAKMIANRCWYQITKLRGGCLADRRVRAKNKAAIIATFLVGRRIFERLLMQ